MHKYSGSYFKFLSFHLERTLYSLYVLKHELEHFPIDHRRSLIFPCHGLKIMINSIQKQFEGSIQFSSEKQESVL